MITLYASSSGVFLERQVRECRVEAETQGVSETFFRHLYIFDAPNLMNSIEISLAWLLNNTNCSCQKSDLTIPHARVPLNLG